MTKKSVILIGLGPMGQAMANAFLDRGHQVTVWNRTASKADELVARGAIRAGTVTEALAANELVLLSLTDYAAVYALLEPAAAALPGRVLVNLSSDTPETVRGAAAWVADCGAQHLTGGPMVPPSGIGMPGSATFYSGPQEVFEAHQETLQALTGTDYRGADPGLAMLYYQLGLDMLWTSMLSYLHAVAVAEANGISAQEFLPYATLTMSAVQGLLGFYAPRIDAGQHPGDVERLSMGVASVEHVVRTSTDAGIDATLPNAVLNVFRRGMAQGYADDSVTSLFEVLKKAAA